MKTKFFLSLFLMASFLSPVCLPAQSAATPAAADPLHSQLQSIVTQVQTKIKAGKTSEADFADELKALDALVAAEKGVKTDEAALLVFMKAQLYLEVINDDEKGAKLLKQIKADYPNTKYGKNVDKMLAQLDKAAAAKKIQASLAVGSRFPDFSESDLEGKPISIASRKGKVVLVDFWATWCGPCRAELPNVINTYKKHHNEGFEIIGVSLDSDMNKLDSFLKQQDGMTWPQYFDGQGWNNKLAVKYGVESIPFAVLVGPDGKIIGKELRGDDLEDAVAKAVAAQ